MAPVSPTVRTFAGLTPCVPRANFTSSCKWENSWWLTVAMMTPITTAMSLRLATLALQHFLKGLIFKHFRHWPLLTGHWPLPWPLIAPHLVQDVWVNRLRWAEGRVVATFTMSSSLHLVSATIVLPRRQYTFHVTFQCWWRQGILRKPPSSELGYWGWPQIYAGECSLRGPPHTLDNLCRTPLKVLLHRLQLALLAMEEAALLDGLIYQVHDNLLIVSRACLRVRFSHFSLVIWCQLFSVVWGHNSSECGQQLAGAHLFSCIQTSADFCHVRRAAAIMSASHFSAVSTVFCP